MLYSRIYTLLSAHSALGHTPQRSLSSADVFLSRKVPAHLCSLCNRIWSRISAHRKHSCAKGLDWRDSKQRNRRVWHSPDSYKYSCGVSPSIASFLQAILPKASGWRQKSARVMLCRLRTAAAPLAYKNGKASSWEELHASE
jgi:hypothetical protein